MHSNIKHEHRDERLAFAACDMDKGVLPASETKHLDVVHHSLPNANDLRTVLTLRQLSGTTTTRHDKGIHKGLDGNGNGIGTQGTGTGTTGTTLWLGAQVLACYLSATLPSGSPSTGTKKVLELGSGVGYLSLVLASMGYGVIATDIEPVLSSVLRPNIEDGLRVLRGRGAETGTGDISVKHLDWNVFVFAATEAESSELKPLEEEEGFGFGHLNTIVMSDTIYHPPLILPLFSTIRRLSVQSGHGHGLPTPTLYFALERRDSRLVDQALETARSMGFELKRVGNGRVAKAVRATGWGWRDESWAGIEVWKGRYKG